MEESELLSVSEIKTEKLEVEGQLSSVKSKAVENNNVDCGNRSITTGDEIEESDGGDSMMQQPYFESQLPSPPTEISNSDLEPESKMELENVTEPVTTVEKLKEQDNSDNGEDIEYKCNLCDKSYSTSYNLSRHFSTNHNQKRATSPDITEGFKQASSGVKRKRKRIDKKPSKMPVKGFPCHLCTQSCSRFDALTRHFGRAHPEESTDQLVHEWEFINNHEKTDSIKKCPPSARSLRSNTKLPSPVRKKRRQLSSSSSTSQTDDAETTTTLLGAKGSQSLLKTFEIAESDPKIVSEGHTDIDKSSQLDLTILELSTAKNSSDNTVIPDSFQKPELVTSNQVSAKATVFDSNNVQKLGSKYLCYACKKTFNNMAHVKRHFRSMHARGHTSVVCNFCQKEFYRTDALNQHVLYVHQGLKPFKCIKCNAAYTLTTNLSRHVKSHHPDWTDWRKIFTYTDGFNAASREGVVTNDSNKNHTLRKSAKKVLRKPSTETSDGCTDESNDNGENEVMLDAFAYRGKFMDDVKIDEDTFRLEVTDNDEKILVELNKDLVFHFLDPEIAQQLVKTGPDYEHISREKEEVRENDRNNIARANTTNQVNDNEKVDTINTKTKLIKNVNKDTNLGAGSLGLNKKWFNCTICSTKFPNPKARNKHVRECHPERLFKCNYCDAVFKRPISLNHHTRKHTGEVSHRCKICQRGFTNPSCFFNHMKTHNPTQCPHCPLKFSMRFTLNNHIRQHHSSKTLSQH